MVLMNNVTAFKWRAQGLQPNFYYSTADSKQVPVELDQVPNDYMTFNISTFDEGPIADDVFEVPANCADKCPRTSICTILRDQPHAT